MKCYYGIIYLSTNLITGKKYVGKTIQSFESRISQHKYKSKIEKNVKFYNSIRKHGWDNFKWEVIDYADSEIELSEKEIEYINKYDSFKNGYNSTLGGEGTVGYGVIDEDIAFKIKEAIRDTSSSLSKIGEYLNVSAEIVSSIYYGNSWSHVLVDGFSPKMDRTKADRDWDCITLTDGNVVEIKTMIRDGFKIKDIAKKFNVTDSLISHINVGKIWRHINVEGFSYSGGRKSGTEHANSKLSKEDVISIKKELSKNELTFDNIADRYNVSKSTIYKISIGETYKNIECEGFVPTGRDSKGDKNGMAKLTESQVVEIKKMIRDGHKNKYISEIFNVMPNAISRIRTGQRWNHINID